MKIFKEARKGRFEIRKDRYETIILNPDFYLPDFGEIGENGKKKGYQYNGGTFVCWHDTYDVIQRKEERVIIGIGERVTAAVHVNDIIKVKG